MKKHLFSIGFLLVFVLMTLSCNKNGSNPSSIVKQYFFAIDKIDEKTIYELVTPDLAQRMVDYMNIEDTKELLNDLGGIKSIEEKIFGNFATVRIIFKDDLTDEIDLIKINGKWKISLEKFSYGKAGWKLLKDTTAVDWWLDDELGN